MSARVKQSRYLHWAKTHFDVRYNLALSGLERLPLERLHPTFENVLAVEARCDGWLPLKERIAKRYGTQPANVAVVHGASMANHLACAALLETGDDVLVESPVYEPLLSVPAYLRARVRTVPRREEDQWALDAGIVKKALTPKTRLIIVTNLHNPSGAWMSSDTLRTLADVADRHGCHVLIDEVYLEFLYAEGERTAASVSPWFVTTRSLTKAYGLDSLRIGWVIAEPHLAERMRRLHDLFSAELAHTAERLAALALDRADELLAPTVAMLREHLDLVDGFIAREERLSWVRPPAGTVGFIRLKRGSVEVLVERLAAQYDTLVTPGRFFGAPGHFRLGWGSDRGTLEEGLRRLGSLLAAIDSK